MTKGPEPTPAHTPAAFGLPLDRHAARRAHSSLKVLPQILPEASVTVLAHEVISRLAARGHQDLEHVADDMADALSSPDDRAGLRLAKRLVAAGTSVEDVYLKHLTGAARRLGERWITDALTSAEVTIAAARIYAIIRALGSSLGTPVAPGDRHAVFAAVAGEQHTLGVTMAADLFRRDGWDIDLMVGREHDALLSELSETEFSLLGLSATAPETLPDLIRLSAAVRVSHPHVKILIGGHLANVEPRLKTVTDADVVSSKLDTLREAMRQFHEMTAARHGTVGS